MSTTNTNLFAASDSDSDSSDMVLINNNSDSNITSGGVSDPVFMHLSRTLTIRELVLLKNVSKTISNLVSTNSVITAQVRWEDDTIDWYYPLYVNTKKTQDEESYRNCRGRISDRLWFGVHRPSGEFHNLPSYSHFLPSGASFHPEDIHASEEGLLLMLLNHPNRSNWRRLVVTNPVTGEWRLLPAPNCKTLGLTSWDYSTFQLRMIADKPANAYKVILIHREWLCVYKSTTNTWSSHILFEQSPLGIRYQRKIPDVSTEHYLVSSTVVNGRIHFAELQYGNDPEPKSGVDGDLNLLERGQVMVYEVDDGAGKWKSGVHHKLESHIPSDLHGDYKNYGFRIGSYKVGIVECMGCMYAIIPAWLHTLQNVDEEFKLFHNLGEEYRRIHDLGQTHVRYIDYGFLKLRFYILRLKGNAGRPFGQLFIQVPGCSSNYGSRYYRGYFLQHHPHANSHAWYRCFARGNVIWVTVAEYMLQYDVLSGRSTTELLHSKALSALPTKHNVAFTPSLYMKPSAQNDGGKDVLDVKYPSLYSNRIML